MGGQLSALISDELWSLVDANSNPLAAGYIQERVKTIRDLGGIAITSTQGMQDLFSLEGGKYGRMCRDYLKEHSKIRYTNYVVDGTLFEHLAEIDQGCNEHKLDKMPVIGCMTDNGHPLSCFGITNLYLPSP